MIVLIVLVALSIINDELWNKNSCLLWKYWNIFSYD